LPRAYSDARLPVNADSISEEEVSVAVKQLKNRKAAGVDNIQPELDGCIVWNAHNTVLSEEALAYLYVSSNTKSPALRPNSVPSGILIHLAI